MRWVRLGGERLEQMGKRCAYTRSCLDPYTQCMFIKAWAAFVAEDIMSAPLPSSPNSVFLAGFGVWLAVLILFFGGGDTTTTGALDLQGVLTYSHCGKSWRENKSIPTFPRADGQQPEKHHLVMRGEGKPMGRLWATAGGWEQRFERASNGMCKERWWNVAVLNS